MVTDSTMHTASSKAAGQSSGRAWPAERYREVRDFSRTICKPLAPEDCVVQSMPDVSPTKWHLAHTSWFFETFFLPEAASSYSPFHTAFKYLFNSYYNAIGPQYPRPRRGLLARPTLSEVWDYRSHVDQAMREALAGKDWESLGDCAGILELGLHHEQQHQELMITDIKHVFSCNPLRPVYRERSDDPVREAAALSWYEYPAGLCWIGHEGPEFAFDNEMPCHQALIHPFRLASKLVTNAEYMAFIEDGGYRRPELWLSAGWDAAQAGRWDSPLYWEILDGRWHVMTLAGLREVQLQEPVCHVSCFEADAFSRWAGARLPTEFEWEWASHSLGQEGNFAEAERFHPAPPPEGQAAGVPAQMFGDVWEWTSSPYTPYPGYKPAAGGIGEYNGKFMCNQFVLRGGSCATPCSHIRRTYRNFFPPDARWQFSGIRLAGDLK